MNYDAYLEMANAVVLQACEDYVNSQLKLMGIKKTLNEETGKYEYRVRYKRNLKDETIVNLRRMIVECITFFKSDWCERLSPNCNGQRLINLLNDHVRNDVAECEKQQAELKRKRKEEKLRKKKTKKVKKEEELVVIEEPKREITQEDIEKALGEFVLEEFV